MAITIVGLGPGPDAWVTAAARAALQAPSTRVFVRTVLHPAVEFLLAGQAFETFDPLYESASSIGEVHRGIVTRLLEADGTGWSVVLAVPGDGIVGEAICGALRAAGASLRLIPGVSVGAGAVAAAGLEASLGLQQVDALSLGGTGTDLQVEVNPRWAAVVTGIYSRSIASDAKLALARVYPPEWEVALVHRAGMLEETVARVPLSEIDRGGHWLDHMTHLVIPPVPTEIPTGSASGVRAVVARLRAPAIGCPWDLEQTHETLVPYMVEEAYEAVDAIRDGPPAHLAEELGDVLLQVALHAEIADQAGEFDWNDVMLALSRKLIHRHPHVFGSTVASSAADVVRNWDALKAAERQGEPPAESALDAVSRGLPSLKQAAELSRKASRAGFDWPSRSGTLEKVAEELGELLCAGSLSERREELGDLLFILAKLANDDGFDPEEALRQANTKFRQRFREVERIAQDLHGEGLSSHSPSELLSLWEQAKQSLASLPPNQPTQ